MSASTLAPGVRLGPYQVLEPVGAGGMGEVYKAMDTRLERVVAVKLLIRQWAEDGERWQQSVLDELQLVYFLETRDLQPSVVGVTTAGGGRVIVEVRTATGSTVLAAGQFTRK